MTPAPTLKKREFRNMKKPREFTKKVFKSWLYSYEPEDIVGSISNSFSCPIARFVWYLYDLPLPNSVSVDTVDINISSTERFTTPQWAATFINRVDSQPGLNITAEEAIKCLTTRRAL